MKSSEIEELVISILAVIIAFVMVFAVQSCQNSATEDVWNNGICRQCEVRYELRAATQYGLKYYVCPGCGLEVERYIK